MNENAARAVLVLFGVVFLAVAAARPSVRVDFLALGLAFLAAGVWLVPFATGL